MKLIAILILMCMPYQWSSAQTVSQSDTLSGKEQALDELVVTANQIPYRLSKGGLTMKVNGTPLSDAGTCIDVLAQLPGVRTDEGNVEVIGKGSPQIYINGRRMLDRSELQRISSKDIQNVELVSNPGAKYGADVKSTILIKTVRKQGDGLSGSLQTAGRLAHSVSNSDNLALNYRTGGMDVFGSFNLDHSRLYQEQRTTTAITAGRDEYFIATDMTIHPIHTHLSATAGVNWQISGDHSVGMRYEYGVAPYSRSEWHSEEVVGINGHKDEDILYDTYWNNRSLPTNSVNAYYHGKVRSFTIDITNDFYGSRSHRTQNIMETSSLSGPTTIGSYNTIGNTLWASKGTATYKFKSKELEFGYEFTSTRRKDRFVNTGDGFRDTDDEIKESTIAGFISLYVPVGKVEFEGGLRYERTVSDYYVYSSFIPEQSRKYGRLFPNFDFSFPIGKANFTLYYTAKTKRPLYSQLGNAIQYDDRFTYETGNPHLVSEMRHNVSLAGMWKWIYFSAGWEYDKEAIISVIKPYAEGSPVQLMSYANFPHLSKYNLVLSLSPKIRRWSPRMRLNLLGQKFGIDTKKGWRRMDTPVLFWNLYNSVNLGKEFNLNADLAVRTQGDMDIVTLKPSYQLNVGLTKNLKGWFFQLQATDVFKTARGSMVTYGDCMTLDKWNYSDTQALRLIVRYSFNATMSRYKGKSAGSTERSRL